MPRVCMRITRASAPKLYREGEPVPDFVMHGPKQHGHDGLALLFGIESPGLTASLAIGEQIAGHGLRTFGGTWCPSPNVGRARDAPEGRHAQHFESQQPWKRRQR